MFSSVTAGAMSTIMFGFEGVGFEMWRRSMADEADGLGACLCGGRVEAGGRRGMGIMASFRGRGEWLVSMRV